MNVPFKSVDREAAAALHPHGLGDELFQRGDAWFLAGCLVCGTWLLGPIGAPMLLYGMYLMMQAEKKGATIRPWSVTIVGGLILVDSSVNYLAWGLDFMPSHASTLARSLWIDYGQLLDGGYALFYNSAPMGGVSVAAEKGNQIASVMLVFPIRIAAAIGFLRMKRWGLQWSIIGNWLYMCLWIDYAANMSLQFETRFGTSDYGVLGFWLVAGIPFLGPLVLLPYLHTLKRELWT